MFDNPIDEQNKLDTGLSTISTNLETSSGGLLQVSLYLQKLTVSLLDYELKKIYQRILQS